MKCCVFALDYPPQLLETTGYWLIITSATQRKLAEAGAWYDSVNHYGPNRQKQRAGGAPPPLPLHTMRRPRIRLAGSMMSIT